MTDEELREMQSLRVRLVSVEERLASNEKPFLSEEEWMLRSRLADAENYLECANESIVKMVDHRTSLLKELEQVRSERDALRKIAQAILDGYESLVPVSIMSAPDSYAVDDDLIDVLKQTLEALQNPRREGPTLK